MSTDHLRGMLQRSDLGHFDKAAIRSLLDDVTKLEERVTFAEEDVVKAKDAGEGARAKAKTAGRLIAVRNRHREFLWQILDDISTAGDMAKDNDAWFRARVNHLVEKRSEVANSPDGFKLEWTES